jgi:hypothetical protein
MFFLTEKATRVTRGHCYATNGLLDHVSQPLEKMSLLEQWFRIAVNNYLADFRILKGLLVASL